MGKLCAFCKKNRKKKDEFSIPKFETLKNVLVRSHEDCGFSV